MPWYVPMSLFFSNFYDLNCGSSGLDPDKYVSTVAPQQERQLGVLDTLIPDAERYKETEPFTVRCNNCSTVTPFQRVPEAQVRS